MVLTYDFSTLKDISSLLHGEKFLEILLSNGLVIDKAGNHEPIRNPFEYNKFSELWEGNTSPGGIAGCYFLFKGQKEARFSGLTIWHKNLVPKPGVINSVALWVNIRKSMDLNKLIKLGDDLFSWSGAEYGYVSDRSKDKNALVNIYNGLTRLTWLNYFGSSYLAETDFHKPSTSIAIGNGVRFNLAESPFSEELDVEEYTRNIEILIGSEWFWPRTKRSKLRVPNFDRSEITRP